MSGIMDFVGIKLEGEATASPLPEMLEVFELLKPKPSAHSLIRIGGNQDGSYLVPDDLSGIGACFSPGVNNFKNFEDILVDTYGIDCHMCDYSSDEHLFQTPLKDGKQTFRKKWLDVKTEGDNISLDDWIGETSPAGDLLLQIDIEGAEYRNLLTVSDGALSRFRIIVLEVHGLAYMANSLILRNVLAPFFKRLDRFFSVVHAHPNNCCGEFIIPDTGIRIPNILELTYIRKDRVASPTYAPLLPHPLDVSRNVPTNPPLFLGDEWLENGRPLESKLKMMEDRLEDLTSRSTAQPTNSSTEYTELILRCLQTITEKTAALAARTSTGDAELRDVAAGRPYALSSSYGDTEGTGIVLPSDTFFFHTDFGKNQFIGVDLGAVYDVRQIRITNRTDACFERAASLFAILSPDSSAGGESVYSLSTPEAFLSGAVKECTTAIPATAARFVTIVSAIETALHFSDLKIMSAD
jgi:hypothetical protein